MSIDPSTGSGQTVQGDSLDFLRGRPPSWLRRLFPCPETFIGSGLLVVQRALPVRHRAGNEDVPGGPLQFQRPPRRDRLPRHAPLRLPEQDREVRMAAEEDPEIRLIEELFRPPGVSRVDRLIEGAERIEGERMGEADIAPGADDGRVP